MGDLPLRRAVSPAQKCGSQNSIGTAVVTPTRYKGLALFGILAALFLLVVACSPESPQSTWDPAGPVAQKQLDLFYFLVWVMLGVFVFVEGALLYAAIRYRRRPGQALPKQTHGHRALEITWTIIPTILIMAVGVWTVITLFDLDDPPASSADDILEVVVTGHQWWWEFEYPDADGSGKSITTANELRVPVDRPVVLKLRSDDVIHSFWIPRLAGKVDVIPTRTNRMWFQADSDEIDTLPQDLFRTVCRVLRHRPRVDEVPGSGAEPGRLPRLGPELRAALCAIGEGAEGPSDIPGWSSRRRDLPFLPCYRGCILCYYWSQPD